MNCKVFMENLNSFVSEDIPRKLAKEMQIHMLSCESCRRFYEEELFIEKAFEEALNFDDIVFESQKDKIMSRIDKDKYAGTGHKDYRSYRNMIKIGGPIAAAIAFIVLINPISRFQIIENNQISKGTQENKPGVQENIKPQQNKKNINTDLSDKMNEEFSIKPETENMGRGSLKKGLSKKIAQSNSASKQEEAAGINDKIEDSLNTELNGNINDKYNSSNSTVDGIVKEGEVTDKTENIDTDRNPSSPEDNGIAIEEIEEDQKKIKSFFARGGVPVRIPIIFNKKPADISLQYRLLDLWNESQNKSFGFYLPKEGEYPEERLYIRDVYNKSNWYLELNFAYRKAKPKYIKWDNGNTLFIVFEEDENEVNCGEELYIVNVKTGEALMIYKVLNDNKGIVDVVRENDDIKIKININKYNDHNEIYEESIIYNAPNL
jgi:hypothetical protein